MEQEHKVNIVLQNKHVVGKTRACDLYEYNGEAAMENDEVGCSLTNLATGKEGIMSKEVVRNNLGLPVTLNLLVSKNPAVLDLIKTLNLVLEK